MLHGVLRRRDCSSRLRIPRDLKRSTPLCEIGEALDGERAEGG